MKNKSIRFLQFETVIIERLIDTADLLTASEYSETDELMEGKLGNKGRGGMVLAGTQRFSSEIDDTHTDEHEHEIFLMTPPCF